MCIALVVKVMKNSRIVESVVTNFKMVRKFGHGGGVPITESSHICARRVMMQNSLTFDTAKVIWQDDWCAH